MLKQVNKEQIEVFGPVSENEKQNEVDEYLRSFDTGSNSSNPLPVIFVSSETLQNYKLTMTPTTLLISQTGNAEKVWIGKWNVSDKVNVFASIKP